MTWWFIEYASGKYYEAQHMQQDTGEVPSKEKVFCHLLLVLQILFILQIVEFSH